MQPGPYPPVTAPPVPSPQVRPAASWYVVAGLVIGVGVVMGVVILVRGVIAFQDRIDDFTRADLPTTLAVDIADTGGYSIYQEYAGASGDRSFGPDLDATVTDPAGDTVDLERYDTSVTYTARGHEGVGVYTFSADEPGTYQVTASGGTGGVAVGRGIGRGLAVAIGASIAVALVGLIAGVAVAVTVAVQRGRHRRSLMPPPGAGGWGPPPPPGWGGPPGQVGYPAAGGPGGPGGFGGAGGQGAYGGPARQGGQAAQGGLAPPPPAPRPYPAPGPPADAVPRRPHPANGTRPSLGGGARTHTRADPPSLRGPVDWSHGDTPLPWSHRRR